jgi:hypothetical protein
VPFDALDYVAQELEKRRQQDWEALLTSTAMLPADLGLALHMVIEKWALLDSRLDAFENFDKPSGRNQFETAFAAGAVAPVLINETGRAVLEDARARYNGESRTTMLNHALGHCFVHVHESASASSTDCDVIQSLWRIREPATFEGMKRIFNLQKRNEIDFPLLAAILKEESR